MELPTLAALLVGGLIAGAINTVAGGGSLITLPLLMFIGLPPTVANGTNRVAILMQNIAATTAFQRSGGVPWKVLRSVAPATLVGAAIGALAAARIPDVSFRPILGVVLVLMGVLLMFRPARWLERESSEPRPLSWKLHLAFLGVGLYAGFIQAGVGFFILAALVPGVGLDLVRSNAVKVSLVLVFTLVALPIFWWAGDVAWLPGVVLGVGNAAGGVLGVKLSLARGERFVRWVLMVMVIASGLYTLGVPQAVLTRLNGS